MNIKAPIELMWIIRRLSRTINVISIAMFISYRLHLDGEAEPLSTKAILGFSVCVIGLMRLGKIG